MGRCLSTLCRQVSSKAPDKAWAFCRASGDMSDRVQLRQQIESRVGAFVESHDLTTLMARLTDAGIAAGPVNSAADICADAHIRERGSIVTVSDRDGRPRVMQAPAGRFSGFEGSIRTPAPSLGEHPTDVLRHDLGLDESEIERLRTEGVI